LMKSPQPTTSFQNSQIDQKDQMVETKKAA